MARPVAAFPAAAVAMPSMRGRDWAMLLALAVLWGGSFFFNGVAVRELPSFEGFDPRI